MRLKELMAIIVMSGTIALAACNTVKGAGEDVQSVANASENAINQ